MVEKKVPSRLEVARDGTSQLQRRLSALDPDYAQIDERSVQDLLAFAKAYAKELQFFDVIDERVEAVGDWSAFFGAGADALNPQEIAAFMENPAQFSGEKARLLSRPHFVLFLSFLKLLSHTQNHLNSLTRRHLDFYYREVLHMVKRAGVPDHVNVLIDLTPDSDFIELPAGTLLDAGTDRLGQDQVYQTDRTLVVNRGQAVRFSSLYVDQQVIGIRETREDPDRPTQDAFMRTLQLVFGQPESGDALPTFPTPTPVGSNNKTPVDYAFLQRLKTFVDFVSPTHGLYMDFEDFFTLIRHKRRRYNSAEDTADWQEINNLLQKAARNRLDNTTYQLPVQNPRAFDTNLATAVGGTPEFKTLTQVETIYDLYNQPVTRPSVENAIQTILFFKEITDFQRMMQLKISIDREWEAINGILEQAGSRRLNAPYTLPANLDPMNFNATLSAALDKLKFPQFDTLRAVNTLDSYYDGLLRIEAYFAMSVQNFQYMMAVAEKTNASRQEWEQVYEILAEAYRKKVIAARQEELRATREKDGFGAMIAFAVGEEQRQSSRISLERLLKYVNDDRQNKLLSDIADRDETEIEEEQWAEVYQIVERAMRVRLGEPVAQRIEWRNLYPTEDARTLRVSLGLEGDKDNPRWKTFGMPREWSKDDPVPVPTFGWAIASPLLMLSAGTRTITLTLDFAASPLDDDSINKAIKDYNDSPFVVQVTTEKGWIEPDSVSIRKVDTDQPNDDNVETLTLEFTLTFDEAAPAIAPLPFEFNALPVLRLMLRQRWIPDATGASGGYEVLYKLFRNLLLRRIQLKVEVIGLIPSQIQNDETALNPTKPFEPFSGRPSVGSRFYLGHPELIYKHLDELVFNIEWMELPAENLKEYYKGYAASTAIAEGFNMLVSLVDNRQQLKLHASAQLFDMTNATKPQKITIDLPTKLHTNHPEYEYKPAREALSDPNDLLAWNRYLQWELKTPDFQHFAYPGEAAALSGQLALDIAAKTTEAEGKTYKINPPYTPKIKQFRLNYTASTEVIMTDYRPDARPDRIFHIQPFGYNEVLPESKNRQYFFLPQYDYEGELYIGFSDIQAPQNLSCLFQMAEGSANADLEPVPVEWSYLSGNQWLTLDDGNVLYDTTRGLINSGIIEFRLEPVEPNTLLPSNYYWIRAAIPRNSESVCDTIAIHTQAVSATFVDQGNAPDRLTQPLPPETITDLVAPHPEIAGIRQPYTSYGGKMPEQDHNFYTRISERLRHKQRALTIWDYEHMILERFPEVYKAKCLPAHPDHPGMVEVIVIPDVSNKLPFNPFEPKAPASLIADIEAYLKQHIPPFSLVKVKNAYYVPVKVRFSVRFLPGYNEGFYKQRLNDDLNRFLSPWAYEDGVDIVIGSRIYANVIINFIEEQPYVDFVAQVKLFSSEDRKTYQLALEVLQGDDGYWVGTDRPDGILVAAQQHEIDIILEAGAEVENLGGINYMKIELDFVVAASD